MQIAGDIYPIEAACASPEVASQSHCGRCVGAKPVIVLPNARSVDMCRYIPAIILAVHYGFKHAVQHCQELSKRQDSYTTSNFVGKKSLSPIWHSFEAILANSCLGVFCSLGGVRK